MRKILILVLALFLTNTNYLFAQKSSCPRGAQDCRGLCGWYIDYDKDGFCDYTLWSPAMNAKRKRCADSLAAIEKAAQDKHIRDSINQIKKQNTETNNPAKDEKTKQAVTTGSDNQKVKSDASNNEAPAVAPATGSVVKENTAVLPPPPPKKSTYDLIVISCLSLSLYLMTFFLARWNLIKKSTHRKIWNIMLLITFLVTGLIGLFLAVQLNYDFKLTWFASLLYWHVEFGIGMAAISIFHILWHLKYWLNILKTPGNKA
jgi:hypothetical protein